MQPSTMQSMTMPTMPIYNPKSNIASRFTSLTWEGTKPTPTVPDHKANFIEKVGNGLLYIPENAPKVIEQICTNPQVITTAIFATAHLANSYTFYPVKTEELITIAISYLPEITSEMIRFAAWVSTSDLITGCCARAGGRLTPAYCEKLAQHKVAPQAGLT